MLDDKGIERELAKFLFGEIEGIPDPYVREGLMLGGHMTNVVSVSDSSGTHSSFQITVEVPNEAWEEHDPDGQETFTKHVQITVKVVE